MPPARIKTRAYLDARIIATALKGEIYKIESSSNWVEEEPRILDGSVMVVLKFISRPPKEADINPQDVVRYKSMHWEVMGIQVWKGWSSRQKHITRCSIRLLHTLLLEESLWSIWERRP